MRPQLVAGKGWLHTSAVCGWEGVAALVRSLWLGRGSFPAASQERGSFPAASEEEEEGRELPKRKALASISISCSGSILSGRTPKMATWRHFWSDPVVPPTMASIKLKV